MRRKEKNIYRKYIPFFITILHKKYTFLLYYILLIIFYYKKIEVKILNYKITDK